MSGAAAEVGRGIDGGGVAVCRRGWRSGDNRRKRGGQTDGAQSEQGETERRRHGCPQGVKLSFLPKTHLVDTEGGTGGECHDDVLINLMLIVLILF